MSYLDQWNTIKKTFSDENADIQDKLKKLKEKLKKENKKDKPSTDKIEDIEALIEETVVVSKTKTGMTQVLPLYDKLLDKMEALQKAGLDPADKTWKVYIKALGEAGKANTKANLACQKVFGKWEEQTTRSYTRLAKTDKETGAEVKKYLTGKNYPARLLLNDLQKMQREIQARLRKIEEYVKGSGAD